jgi:hypothetical protein
VSQNFVDEPGTSENNNIFDKANMASNNTYMGNNHSRKNSNYNGNIGNPNNNPNFNPGFYTNRQMFPGYPNYPGVGNPNFYMKQNSNNSMVVTVW